MSLAVFLTRFRDLHRKDAAGALAGPERQEYLRARDELARALLAAQRIALKPGEVARESLRVARAVQVDLEWPKGRVRAASLDLSVGGFSTLMARAPSQKDVVKCTLRLPGGAKVEAEARVAGMLVQPAAVRVSYAFHGLSQEDRDSLERLVFDTVLEQLAR